MGFPIDLCRSMRDAASVQHVPGDIVIRGLNHIRRIDYRVIHARDLKACGTVMGFPLLRALSEIWIEYRIGSTTLALTTHGARFADAAPPLGALSVQLAFRVPPHAVTECATDLAASGVEFIEPITDQAFGHRTLFFRDPDGNILEIYAEI